MKELIPMDEFGCLAGRDKTVRVKWYLTKITEQVVNDND